MEVKRTDKRRSFLIARAVIEVVLVLAAVGTATYAWLVAYTGLGIYVPISSPEALYIGAGHRDFDAEHGTFENDDFEDIRYMYFDGLDVENDEYIDKVFCVYGNGVANYRIQLAYTTNNDFTYGIFHATESSTPSAGAVAYTTHQSTPQTYYYSVNGEAIAGSVAETTLSDTYGEYENVHSAANPVYWQTAAATAETGNSRGDFINYYILRVYRNGKITNDRETDVLCIAAKTYTV